MRGREDQAKSRQNRCHALLVLCLVALILLQSCGAPAPPPRPQPVEPSPDGGLLNVRLRSDVDVINPLAIDENTRMVGHLLFAGLTRLNAQLLPMADLAETWDLSPDELTWTFRLWPGLKWHDGTPLTSDDVVFTFETLLRLPAANAAEFDVQQTVSRVEKIDATGIRVLLRRRFAPLAADMAMPILPAHLMRGLPLEDLRHRQVAVGSGPYKLLEHRPGQAIVLVANPDYHFGRPHIDKVAFLVADEAVTLRALQEGEMTIAELDRPGQDQEGLPLPAEALADQPQLRSGRFVETGFDFVGFNLRPGRLFSDRSLRLAWAYGIDKPSLVTTVTHGSGIPLWSDITPASWAYDATLPQLPRDVARARQLMREAGWTDVGGDGIAVKAGQRLSVDLLVREDAPSRLEAARLMAQQLRDIGMLVNVVPADFGSTLAAKRRPPFDFDALLMGWDRSADPDDYPLFHSSQMPTSEKPALLNFVGFGQPEFDDLTVRARGVLDVKQRQELYGGTQRILAQELPYYFLWANQTQVVYNKRLQGPVDISSPAYFWNVEQWYLAQP